MTSAALVDLPALTREILPAYGLATSCGYLRNETAWVVPEMIVACARRSSNATT